MHLSFEVLVQMARSKKACLIFFDEVDAIGGARFDDGAGEPSPAKSRHTSRPCIGIIPCSLLLAS